MSRQCVSVRQVPGHGYVYHAPALYQAKERADGVATWRFVKHLGGHVWGNNGARLPAGRRSEALA